MDSTIKDEELGGNSVFGFVKLLKGHRFLLDVIGENDLYVHRLDSSEQVMKFDEMPEHISSMARADPGVLRKIIAEAQKRLAAIS